MRSSKFSEGRWGLASILTLLAASHVMAISRPAPIGTVLLSSGDNGETGLAVANINTAGTTIYEGDTLKTDKDESLRVRLNGPQMVMHSNSVAEVHAIDHGFSANFKQGDVVIYTLQGQTFKVFADGVTIRPAGDVAVVAQIALVSANEIDIGSEKGPLELSFGTEVKTVEPGSLYRLEVETNQPKLDPQGSPPLHAGANHFRLILIGAVSIGTGIAIWRALVSPSAP